MRFGSAYVIGLAAALSCFPIFASGADVATVSTRARELGVPFDGAPGELNAITDVLGVEVGHTTLLEGEGKLIVGKGPVRTGVTAIFPLGKNNSNTPVPAAVYAFNGNGEMTGSAWVEESGFLEGPVMLTNTHSVGVVRDAVVEWGARKFPQTDNFSLPVVGETWDGGLNDIGGFHVGKEDVFRALDSAESGPVAEGNAGGGTGMCAFGFKAGTGTASRVVGKSNGGFCVGVLVQANLGRREQLMVSGVPVGKEITELQPVSSQRARERRFTPRSYRDRCATASPSIETGCQARGARHGAYWRYQQQFVRRLVRRLFYRDSWACRWPPTVVDPEKR